MTLGPRAATPPAGVAVSGLYEAPEIYEIAFSYRNLEHEVDVIAQLIDRHAQVPVRHILEVACGPAVHAPLLCARGYAYTGIDNSAQMLAYAGVRAAASRAPMTLVAADLRAFSLPRSCQFAFITLGSLCLESTRDLQAHFNAVAGALESGGLYLLESCVNYAPNAGRIESWQVRAGTTLVDTTYECQSVDAAEQIIEERLTVVATTAGQQRQYSEVARRREIYPQEFLLFLAADGRFDFLCAYNDWQVGQPLDGRKPVDRPLAVLRRR